MNNVKKIYIILLALSFINSPVYALSELDNEHIHITDAAAPLDKDIDVKIDEAVIIVHGIVCSFCSKGVQKKLSKLSFIDKSKYIKGVLVDIEHQMVTFAIKPGEEADLQQVYKAIKSGGYEPIKAFTIGKDGSVKTYSFEKRAI